MTDAAPVLNVSPASRFPLLGLIAAPLIPRFACAGECCTREANTQPLHPKLKCGALHTEMRSRSSRSGKDAIRRFQRAQNFGPFRLVQDALKTLVIGWGRLRRGMAVLLNDIGLQSGERDIKHSAF